MNKILVIIGILFATNTYADVECSVDALAKIMMALKEEPNVAYSELQLRYCGTTKKEKTKPFKFKIKKLKPQSVPEKFRGVWTPVGKSCQSKNRLQVDIKTVTLINGSDSLQFGDINICYSCIGGASYGGIIEVLTPNFNSGGLSPFDIIFNHGEKMGRTVVNMQSNKLKQRFLLDNVKLEKCKK